MGLVKADTFICLDCETTGLDPKADKIIEVAVARFRGQEILETFDTLVDPCCPIPELSTSIHHITQDMVAGKPMIQEVLPQLLEFIGDSIIVGHGIPFDIELVANAAAASGIATPIGSSRFIDTLRMARLYGGSKENSLAKLCNHFNIEIAGAHRALNDVLVNVSVFYYLSQNFKTTEQIFEALSRPIEMKAMPLGKHKGRPFKEIPVDYLRWAAHQNFDEDLLYSLRSELKRRKQGAQFGQAANPFSAL